MTDYIGKAVYWFGRALIVSGSWMVAWAVIVSNEVAKKNIRQILSSLESMSDGEADALSSAFNARRMRN